MKTIEIRKGLTDEWKRGGVTEAVDFATLTDLMFKTWSGMTTREYKMHRGLTKESLRDNMIIWVFPMQLRFEGVAR